MKYKIANTLEQWSTIQALGTCEGLYKNGELWWFDGELWYLSILELSPEDLREVMEFYKGVETI